MHSAHALAPVLPAVSEPAAQALQSSLVTLRTAMEAKLSEHGVQVAVPADSAYVPAVQFLQSVFDVDPNVGRYVPASHAVHTLGTGDVSFSGL